MLIGILAPLMAGLSTLPAQAVCGPRDEILSSLARQYSENPRELGLSDTGSVIELTTTRDGKTWTLLMTKPDGTTCIVAAGEGWQPEPQSVAGQPL